MDPLALVMAADAGLITNIVVSALAFIAGFAYAGYTVGRYRLRVAIKVEREEREEAERQRVREAGRDV